MLLLASCDRGAGDGTHGTGRGTGGGSGGEVPASAPDALPGLESMREWALLAYRPDYQVAARTEVVKVIVDLEDEWKTYFLQSERWELHYSFARAFIDDALDHGTFNIQQYRRPDRRFLLCSLVRYLDGDVWTMELVAGDTMEAERLARFRDHVAERVFFGEQLKFRPLSPMQERHAQTLGARLPSIDADALMANVRYQPLVTGEAYGYLRIVRGRLDVSAVRPSDVLVTEHVPNELPPVGGLVTSRLQAPLAHVAVLSRNRGTPDMAVPGAIDDERFTALEGQLVRLRVTPQDFVLERASAEDAERHWQSRRPSRTFVPRADLAYRDLEEVCSIRLEDGRFAGAKASQLGEVCGIEGIETPGGFVVPFAYYRDHLARHTLLGEIQAMHADGAFRSDRQARAARLAALRTSIEAGEVTPALVAAIAQRMAGSGRRWIFRSSTNAEDLVGFNGAGLYESVVVDAGATPAQIADAMRKVWASVWLQRGWEEREWYRIDHPQVQMAVLIQPFVDDVVGNGVAITRNPFDEGRPGVYINVQAQGGSVTGAGDDELPEQVMIYTWAEDLEFEVISRSTRTNGAAILTEADLHALGAVLQRLHDELSPLYDGDANAVDVEMLLTRGDRRFVVVQARPIAVRYTSGQEWRTP